MNNVQDTLLEVYDQEVGIVADDEILIHFNRFKEICPPKKVEDMSRDELAHDCGIAFIIIGYQPKNLEKSVDEVLESSESKWLYEFVFNVWVGDRR